MAQRKRPVDKVRASRDGHEYHETWVARKAMQLLRPDSDLTAIAVEGLSPSDQEGAAAEAVEIADITLYHGGAASFECAARVTIAQCKYSIADQDAEFRSSHAKKTISKFAVAYQDSVKRYGAAVVREKLGFSLITNRPVFPAFLQAIHALAENARCCGAAKKQADQFTSAANLSGAELSEFAAKFKVIGLSGSLQEIGHELSTMLVDWSGTTDSLASARLGQLRKMVRDKAGHVGTDRNIMKKTDVLAAFDIGDPEELLPCPPALPDVGIVVEREQLADVAALLPFLSEPLLIHAAGGVGKTVFMQSLAAAAERHSDIVFFDCFGGGAYRSPEDARHLPRRGLVHIANTLAFRGRCDPILPGCGDVETLLRAFRRRLAQYVKTLGYPASGRGLILFIDAMDNAEMIAGQQSGRSFPVLVLESLHHSPIDGVKLIVSCRTERKPHTSASYREFELKPFTIKETARYLQARMASVSNAEINVAQARSGGNPRVLEHFIESGSRLFDVSEIENKVELDDLIQQRISDALRAAGNHGYSEETINAFLAGLAVLPPPVPLDEYADAHGLEKSAVESFASDLHPLLERTSQGLMFRDEPTETLVHKRYSASKGALQDVAARLMERQDVSVYASRALPNLLHLLDDGDRLFALAFDERYPASITSTVGRRNVRYARLKAATLHAAIRQNHNHLVRLLLELSTVAAIDQRGTDYILDSPDLVVAAKDADASRRLFEARTGWPGARHARLTIAHTLSGDIENAYRHAVIASEWVEHYLKTEDNDKFRESRPDHRDIAAIPFFLIIQGRVEQAAQFLQNWYPWYAYEVCEYIFSYLHQVQRQQSGASPNIDGFIDAIRGVAPLTAALSFSKFEDARSKAIIKRIAALCDGEIKMNRETSYGRNGAYKLQDGLRKSSAMAVNLGLHEEALKISQATSHGRPSLWIFRDTFYDGDVFSFLFHQALVAALNGAPLHEMDMLPKELEPICTEISAALSGASFRKAAKDAIESCVKRRGPGIAVEDGGPLSYEDSQRAEKFIDTRLELILNLALAFSKVLSASSLQLEQAFSEMLNAWEGALARGESYSFRADEMVFRFLGRDMAMFVLWSRSDLGLSSIQCFLNAVHSSPINAETHIQIVAILARRQALHEVAGAQAVKARATIEVEDDVTYRASLFARLGRAILPASRDEASAYFHSGLEQMDAIGSGDYEFLNELLLFAATLKGDELEPRDFHALGNICELNMGEEPEKFFWGAYARAMSRTSGLKGLARISRWDDRSKVGLDCTLMPYLTALVADRKIDAELAVSLNYLADPAEFYFNGTKEFSEAIQESVGNSCPDIVSELIRQYRHNNPGVSSGDTVKALAELSTTTFGNTPEPFYLSEAHSRFSELIDTNNYLRNYHGERHAQLHEVAAERKLSERAVLESIVTDVSPVDLDSLTTATSKFQALNSAYKFRDEFFSDLRRRVTFGERQIYIKNLLLLEGFHFYWVLDELEACKDEWGSSSTALTAIYADAARPLVRLHADDLIGHNRLSGSYLSKISNVTGVHVSKLALELVEVFAQQDDAVPGSVWLALGSFLCPEADVGPGQQALQRLLRSDAPRLADNVVDGKLTVGLYPDGNAEDIAAGIIWRVLGSPKAEDRWRAAHSIRCLARFGRWGGG
ncbi:MAG: ATP-binding protein [Alphaproteobacteria bacterium]|nr:ATP-binding protein [Alphaproteobacteria bacterium]